MVSCGICPHSGLGGFLTVISCGICPHSQADALQLLKIHLKDLGGRLRLERSLMLEPVACLEERPKVLASMIVSAQSCTKKVPTYQAVLVDRPSDHQRRESDNWIHSACEPSFPETYARK